MVSMVTSYLAGGTECGSAVTFICHTVRMMEELLDSESSESVIYLQCSRAGPAEALKSWLGPK